VEKVRIIFDGHEIEVESDKVAGYRKIELDFESIEKTEKRREKRTREETGLGISPLPLVNPDATLDPCERLVIKERNAKIHQAVNKLPHRQKEVVEKVIFESRSLTDVAKEMGCTFQTNQVHLQRALKNLKTVLESENA
jgi:RNA polymerase sigma factor (sigma-70 family)